MYTGGKDAWSKNKVATDGVERDPAVLHGHHWRGQLLRWRDGATDLKSSRRCTDRRQSIGRDGQRGQRRRGTHDARRATLPQLLLLIDATDKNGTAFTPLDPARDDPADAQHANRIIDVGDGCRQNGFFGPWEIEKRKSFPEMP